MWQSLRDRLIGYVAGRHYWDEGLEQWGYSNAPSNQFSVILSGILFFHKYVALYIVTSVLNIVHMQVLWVLTAREAPPTTAGISQSERSLL